MKRAQYILKRAQYSPINHEKSPVHPEKSPIYPEKVLYVLILRCVKRALYVLNLRCVCHILIIQHTMYHSTHLHQIERTPYTFWKEPYRAL